MLAVLDVFTPDHPVCTADEVGERLNYSRGTAYRYIRELCAAGLLHRTPSGFTLGPRIIELDLAIRLCDPVLAAAQNTMRALRDRFDCDVLLTRFFDDRVVVCYHEQGVDRPQVSYGRGRVMPLFRGAGSKMLLASLSVSRQRRLYQQHKTEISEAGMGKEWRAFRATLVELSQTGSAVSLGELDEGNVGVAAVIPDDEPNLPSGLVMVFRAARYAVLDKPLLGEAVREAVAKIAATPVS